MRSLLALFILTFSIALTGCGGSTEKAERGEMPIGNAATPTEAYKMLFSAVKSKDPEKIKMMLSSSTMKFAEARAKQVNQDVNEIVRNGFSAPTMGEKLPQMRDEQVKDNFGMVEVYNSKEKRWEMAQFINENGGWKLAVGDVIAGTWQQPGKSQSTRDMENSNTNPPQMVPGANVDWNNVKTIKIDPKSGNFMKGPNPIPGNAKPQKIPTH